MKILKVNSHEILLDDEDYELVKDLRIRVDCYGGLNKFQKRPVVNGSENLVHFIRRSEARVHYLDRNTLNLQRSNLHVPSKDGPMRRDRKPKREKTPEEVAAAIQKRLENPGRIVRLSHEDLTYIVEFNGRVQDELNKLKRENAELRKQIELGRYFREV
jgi:hypothetical protein